MLRINFEKSVGLVLCKVNKVFLDISINLDFLLQTAVAVCGSIDIREASPKQSPAEKLINSYSILSFVM